MALTARELNRATLARQLLLRRERVAVTDAMRRVVALQAQEPASPYVAMWNRLDGFDPTELDDAFATHAVVKATLMRITLHAVHVDDYPTFHEAMQGTLRAARLHDRRFTSSGLNAADADALVPFVLDHAAAPRTNSQMEVMLADHLGAPPEPGVWWALRSFAPLVHAPTGGPWAFGRRPAYLAAPTGAPREDRDRAVQGLVRRYLEGFGPASAQDIGQFALLRQPAVRAALAALAGELETVEGPGGTELFDVPGAPRPADEVVAPPRLMAMWDNTLLAYADRSRVVPDAYRQLVLRRNGDVLPTLLVDGYVCGVWRPVDDGIEALAFQAVGDATWDGLATEAGSLLSLLADREPTAYRRYDRWWPTLPSAEVRVLPG